MPQQRTRMRTSPSRTGGSGMSAITRGFSSMGLVARSRAASMGLGKKPEALLSLPRHLDLFVLHPSDELLVRGVCDNTGELGAIVVHEADVFTNSSYEEL